MLQVLRAYEAYEFAIGIHVEKSQLAASVHTEENPRIHGKMKCPGEHATTEKTECFT